MSYEDKRVTHEWRRYRGLQKADDRAVSSDGRRPWFVQSNGREALDALVEQLSAQRVKSCVYERDGAPCVASGLISRVTRELGLGIESELDDPPAAELGVWKEPEYPDRYYQTEAVEALSQYPLGAVELPTGSGKTRCIARLVQRFGGRGAVVVVPTKSIASQMVKSLSTMFGRDVVGSFFDSKKESGKKVVVIVGKSLTLMEAGDKHATALAKKKLLVGDESHLLAADTLVKGILGTLAPIPRRYFLSATQIRTDGLDMVLEGVTGPVVYRKTYRELADEGYLAKVKFVQWSIRSESGKSKNGDAIAIAKAHLRENKLACKHAVAVASAAVARGIPTMILIQEVSQISHLLAAGLPREALAVAHGGCDKKNKKIIPHEYQDSDPDAAVKGFIDGTSKILVGTGCIGIGTDIPNAGCIVNLTGVSSEATVRQNVGRGARLAPGKTMFWYHDYSVSGVPILEKQAAARADIFAEIYAPPVQKEVR